MDFINQTPLIQYKSCDFLVSFNRVINKDNISYNLNNLEMLPNFKVVFNLDNYPSLISNASLEYSVLMPKFNSITANVNDQYLSLDIVENHYNVENNKNLIVDYGDKEQFKLKVVDDYGVVGSEIEVVLKINGKSYTIKSDENGHVSKIFSLAPGKYNIYTICDGKTLKNTITVKNVLKAKNISKKKSRKITYSAALKTFKGKSIVGKKITFKIKGKTYSTKTNKQGIAKVTFKNLKVGKYFIVVKYLNSHVKTTLKIKK